MKRAAPRIEHQQRLTAVTSTIDLFRAYQTANRAGKENSTCPRQNL